jgi:hypothetical protein
LRRRHQHTLATDCIIIIYNIRRGIIQDHHPIARPNR